MRQISAEARLHPRTRSESGRTGNRIYLAALCGALAVIVAVIFGTLSVRPF